MTTQEQEQTRAAWDRIATGYDDFVTPTNMWAISEPARITKPGGRVLMTVLGAVQRVEFFGFFIRAIQAAVPGFTGPPVDPPPLPFQLQDPQRLHQEMARVGLKEICVASITEKLEYQSGQQLWDWVTNSNPIAGAVLAEAKITKEQTEVVRHALDRMVRERAGASGTAVLTVPINIGVGTK
jgi:hypothetical protein